MAAATPWTDKHIEQLRRLWTDGYSAGEIAVELRFGTRSSIMGKIYRLGLQRRLLERSSTPVRKRAAQKVRVRRRMTVSRPAPKPPPPVEQTPSIGLPLLELQEHQCRWPLGDLYARAELFCAADRDPGVPYCPFHMEKAKP